MLYTITELGNIFKINYRHMLEYRKFLTPSTTVISLKNMDVMTYDINLAKT